MEGKDVDLVSEDLPEITDSNMDENVAKEDLEVEDIMSQKQESVESEPSDIFESVKDTEPDDVEEDTNPPKPASNELENCDTEPADTAETRNTDVDLSEAISDDPPKPKTENNNEVDLTDIDIGSYSAKAVDDLKEVREGDKEMLAMISQDEEEEEEDQGQGHKMKYERNSDKIKAQAEKDYPEEITETQEEEREAPEDVPIPKHQHPLSPLVSWVINDGIWGSRTERIVRDFEAERYLWIRYMSYTWKIHQYCGNKNVTKLFCETLIS